MVDVNKKIDRQLDLYKTEYATAAVRYENLYKALWQNFNYMAVLAGAVVAFGRDQFGVPVSLLAGTAILAAWYWMTFEPLNRYGDDAEKRLGKIERILSRLGNLRDDDTCVAKTDLGLRHFDRFSQERQSSDDQVWTCIVKALAFLVILLIGLGTWWCGGGCGDGAWVATVVAAAILTVGIVVIGCGDFRLRLRVRNAVRLFALYLHIAIIGLLVYVGPDWGKQLRAKAETAAIDKVDRAAAKQQALTLDIIRTTQSDTDMKQQITKLNDKIQLLIERTAPGEQTHLETRPSDNSADRLLSPQKK